MVAPWKATSKPSSTSSCINRRYDLSWSVAAAKKSLLPSGQSKGQTLFVVRNPYSLRRSYIGLTLCTVASSVSSSNEKANRLLSGKRMNPSVVWELNADFDRHPRCEADVSQRLIAVDARRSQIRRHRGRRSPFAAVSRVPMPPAGARADTFPRQRSGTLEPR